MPLKFPVCDATGTWRKGQKSVDLRDGAPRRGGCLQCLVWLDGLDAYRIAGV